MAANGERLARDLERALRAAGDPARAAQEKRYLRSELEHLGATVPVTRRVVRTALRGEPAPTRAEVLGAVEALWSRPVHECRAAAVELLEARGELLRPSDLPLLERLLREARTWALVDNLAASVLGPLAERFPALERRIGRWVGDEDFWLRRAALLAELVALREGRGDFDRFGRRAEALLDDREFFVAKAIGWVLRDTSRRDPARVAAWLRPRAARAAAVTVREAVKRLAPRDRAAILAARGAGGAGRRGAATHGGRRAGRPRTG
jgi:3-methyladenine DNA glycosylase AlkD